MSSHIVESKITQAQPSFLWLLMLSYTMVVVIANWFDPRLIQVFNLDTDAGTLISPVNFLLSGLITEVYGYKHARRTIWCGFLFNVIFIIFGQLITHMPSPAFPTNNALFDTLLATNARIILAFTISYLSSEPLNAYFMAKLKIRTKGRHIGIRLISSTIVTSGIDSAIFNIITFYGSMNNHKLANLIITMWLIRIIISILWLHSALNLTRKLKVIEQLDISDKRTKFNLFSLKVNYAISDNNYFIANKVLGE